MIHPYLKKEEKKKSDKKKKAACQSKTAVNIATMGSHAWELCHS